MSPLKRMKYGLVLAFAFLILLCGCSAKNGERSEISEESEMYTHGISKEYWKSASYSMDDIKAKVHPTLYYDKREFKPDDYSDDALRAYNSMLGYAERIVGTEYYVYDYYYADWTEPPNTWVIKIVPYEMARTAESENRRLYFDEWISLFYDEDGSSVKSCLEPYFMERKWFDDLERELSENFPEYEFVLAISVFEGYYPNILEERFEDYSDYTCIINDEFYGKSDEYEYGNILYLNLPSGTEREKAAEIFEQVKPILIKYCVTEVKVFTPNEYEFLEELETFKVLV